LRTDRQRSGIFAFEPREAQCCWPWLLLLASWMLQSVINIHKCVECVALRGIWSDTEVSDAIAVWADKRGSTAFVWLQYA